MKSFHNIAELLRLASERQLPVHEIVLTVESEQKQRSKEELIEEMRNNWHVMHDSVKTGLKEGICSVSGLTGGDAPKLYRHQLTGFLGQAAVSAAAFAVAASEVNASMGRIVACPTAGSCGILPAVLTEAYEQGCSEDDITMSLFTAAGIGMVIDENASIAGASGGCQAECGSAAGMAAAALAEIGGGTPEQIGHAAALAIKNLLGLACDPVAGLVEVPCVKRNGFVAVHAMLAADMALAGVKSVIPVDEVIEAMDRIGKAMPRDIKETAEGGLAATKTGRALQKQIYG
ncbi:MAG: L-serine ammonia-lyase, iron-sulfur-dependent, subunit alpha [Schwartzia sp.]|nr:L-serine ammonia-lyase, iron-sulfur-dependent, subunit alpha [Schwartzia sp. (in: firmicutes)]